MPDWLLLLLLVLAAYRLTRLVVEDTLFDAPREWLERRWPRGLGFIITCPFCASVWIASGVVGLTWIFEPIPLPFLWFGAVAGGVSLLYEILPARD